MEVITHDYKDYPAFQAEGNAARWIMPFAQEFCKGNGVDVGCSNPFWAYPGAWPVDIEFDDEYHAMNLPGDTWDYIFSSHCLEHLHDWVGVLDYWDTKLKEGGCMFLYLPHYSQTYWRPWNNRKHVNIMRASHIEEYFWEKDYEHVWATGKDLNNSFAVAAVK